MVLILYSYNQPLQAYEMHLIVLFSLKTFKTPVPVDGYEGCLIHLQEQIRSI